MIIIIIITTTNIGLLLRPFVQIFWNYGSSILLFFLFVFVSLFFSLFHPLSVHLLSFSLEVVLGLPVPCDQWVRPIKQVLIGCTNRGRSGVFKAPSWAPDVGVLIRTWVPKSVRRYGRLANPHRRMTVCSLVVGHFGQLLSQFMAKTDTFLIFFNTRFIYEMLIFLTLDLLRQNVFRKKVLHSV